MDLTDPQYQRTILADFLNAYPDKRRLFFVHVPKCAGSDLSKHLSATRPAIPERLRNPNVTKPEEYAVVVQSLIDQMPTSTEIFIRGHWRLLNFVDLRRPQDQLFTVLRDPIDMCLSQVNYILTRMQADTKRKAGNRPRDVARWMTQLDVTQFNRDDVPVLVDRILAHEKTLPPNRICWAMGHTNAKQARELMVALNVEVVLLPQYQTWLATRWGVTAQTRTNASERFVTRDDLTPAQIDRLNQITAEDRMLYSMLEGR